MSRLVRTIAPAVASLALAAPVVAPATAATAPVPARAAATVRAAGPVHETRVIGRTRQGRAITAYRLGQPGKPVVVVLATIHGGERMNHYVAQSLRTGRPVQGIDLWVVEYANPDGWARGSRYNAAGVDLNRNFPTKWSRAVRRAGRGPASEPETRAIMAFLNRTDPKYLLGLHQPFNGIDTYNIKDKAFGARLRAQLGLRLLSFDCTGGCHGTMTQWFNANHKGTGITVEWGARPTRAQMVRAADGILRAVGGRR